MLCFSASTGVDVHRQGPWLCLALLFLPSCGYRIAGRSTHYGEHRTIAVPVFVNRTTSFKIEQRLAEAVRRELIRRTAYRVVPSGNGDVVLSGEVLSYNAIPIIFNEQGRGSAYTVFIDLKLRASDSSNGATIFSNDLWTFREVFELGQSSRDFVPEDSAAVDRLTRRVASAVVAALLNSRS